jgi:hypothetical protein
MIDWLIIQWVSIWSGLVAIFALVLILGALYCTWVVIQCFISLLVCAPYLLLLVFYPQSNYIEYVDNRINSLGMARWKSPKRQYLYWFLSGFYAILLTDLLIIHITVRYISGAEK